MKNELTEAQISDELLRVARRYMDLVHSNDVAGDDPIYRVMEDIDAYLAAPKQLRGLDNS